jgi:hypothetical protein
VWSLSIRDKPLTSAEDGLQFVIIQLAALSEGEVRLITGREGPEWDQRYNCCFNLGAGWGLSGQRHAPAALLRGKGATPSVQQTGWAPGPVWSGAENLTVAGIRSRTVQPVSNRYTGPPFTVCAHK